LCVTKIEWNNCPALLITLRDITARKTSEEQLRNALEELKFALASERVLLEELDRKNKDLTELSITDGLTGLFNHRYVQELFDLSLNVPSDTRGIAFRYPV